MKKKLISVDNLAGYVCRSENRIYVDGTMILTPGAKDALSKKGIAVVRATCPDAAGCSHAGHGAEPSSVASGAVSPEPVAVSPVGSGTQEGALTDLLVGVAALIKTEYGITDCEQLKTMSLQILKTLRESIGDAGHKRSAP